MKIEPSYLSEEELENLILDIEENDLVSAPPELLNQVLNVIESSEQYIKNPIALEVQRKRIIEFRKYCFQVITSVAAAIVVVFLFPTSTQIQKSELPSIPSKDMILSKQIVKSKEDTLSNNTKDITLEEFLKDIEWFHIFE